MEYIDIVDENGNKTGEVRSRVDVHKHGLLFRSVHIWCVNSNNEILLQKRAYNKKNFPGLWDISVGGLVSSGESLIDAAKKEVSEEIGLEVNEEDLEFFATTRQHLVYNDYIDNGICTLYLLRTNLSIDKFSKQDSELADLRWFSFEEFKKMVEEKNPELVPHWEEYDILIDKLK